MFKESVKVSQDQKYPGQMHSPVFHELVELLANHDSLDILDLGNARSGSVSFFNQFNCRYHIADAYSVLSTCDKAEEESDPQFQQRMLRLFSEILPLPENRTLSLILCWDGLNYLTRQTSRLLSKYLAGFCDIDSLVHCYLYGPRVIPRQWGRFNILSDEYVGVEYLDQETGVGPAYSQTDLKLLLPDFTIRKSILLKSGIQEYMLHPDMY